MVVLPEMIYIYAMYKILLVEDNPDDVDLAVMALEKNGMASEVAVAHDGVEALEYLNCLGRFAGRDPNRLPRVVLLDLKMPRMDGLEFLQRIRAEEKTRLLPVVVYTTSTEDNDKIESYRRGANSYLTKPVNYRKMVENLQQVATYWLELNEAV